MSIATRITSIEGHIEQAYDELQGLGADLTNVNKNIDNISMVLDDIYDSMPQVSGEGTSLTLDDTRVGKIKSTLKGNTSQDGTPTPSSPIPVNVVSGDNEINICGKNLFDGELENGTYDTGTGQPQSINTSYRNKNIIRVKENATYTFSINGTSQKYCLYFYDKNKSFISSNISLTAGTFTTPANTEYVNFRCFGSDYVSNFSTLKVQLEKGSTATTYEVYQGANYSVNLGTLELCKIGDYEDKPFKAVNGDETYDSLTDAQKEGLTIGNWYVYKVIDKHIFDGTETWTQNSYGTNSWNLTNVISTNYVENKLQILSNLFLGIPASGRNNAGNNVIYTATNTSAVIRNTTYTTLAEVRTATTGGVIYYVLATPTINPITDEDLIAQLEAIKNAISYNGQTNISQTNDNKPFRISASALKEWSV